MSSAVCENCSSFRDGNYGSGRFCSKECARGFSTKRNRSEISRKTAATLRAKTSASTRVPAPVGANSGRNRKPSRRRKALKGDFWHWRDFDALKTQESRRARGMFEQDGKCNKCGLVDWMGMAITLEMDHIDGDRFNNSRSNLECACPNCHSMTPTWRGRGRGPVGDNTNYRRSAKHTPSAMFVGVCSQREKLFQSEEDCRSNEREWQFATELIP